MIIVDTELKFISISNSYLRMPGEHEWVEGECQHGPLVSTKTDKTYMDKNSKAFEAIRQVVLDKRSLSSLHHYVTFRYTEQ